MSESDKLLNLFNVKYQSKPWQFLEGSVNCRSLRIERDKGNGKPLIPTDITITQASVQIIDSRTSLSDPVTVVVDYFDISSALVSTSNNQLQGYDLMLTLTNSITTSDYYQSGLVTGNYYQANFRFIDDVTGKLDKLPTFFIIKDENFNPHE